MLWFFSLFTRIALLFIWITTPVVNRVFHENWIWPLLGILFLPLTTLTYLIVFDLADGVSGWNWFWIVGAVLLDLGTHASSARHAQQRRSKASTVVQ